MNKTVDPALASSTGKAGPLNNWEKKRRAGGGNRVSGGRGGG